MTSLISTILIQFLKDKIIYYVEIGALLLVDILNTGYKKNKKIKKKLNTF